MSDISLEALQLAVNAVEDGLNDYSYAKESASRLVLIARDGAIQRFEVAMDLTRQMVIRVLKEKYAMDEASAKRGWIREAAKLGMIADAESWFGFLSARDRTSHTYDAEIAANVFAQIPEFLAHVRHLLQRLPAHVA
ncbi:MAG: HI0074 family nucleotidyltransferase substrate-binding subunit [Giesbergeria sp.]|uniref:HI0074 family nucleotidyltransferase substrate-binding subunit n=1 Tax=Giesbergeria sp. TaxID=2818473 RepID=UPI00261CCA34|nr:HI0074 family nucleotidyltransferase substrate-binding subunit [Giesbergeria sp.]MDD2608096.1 HI0074 family nucleotidyltransferase substrate-binding subunit [Giesbergeria sp.]